MTCLPTATSNSCKSSLVSLLSSPSLLIQVAVHVSSLDKAGGRDDLPSNCNFQLLQILAGLVALLALLALLFAAVFALRHWHGTRKGKEEDEKCLHGWAP